MAAVHEPQKRPPARLVVHCSTISSQKALMLEAAREILAEVFGIRLSEVDEMIQSRFQNSDKKAPGEDDGLWPQELWI
jgi:hypothetical protein